MQWFFYILSWVFSKWNDEVSDKDFFHEPSNNES